MTLAVITDKLVYNKNPSWTEPSLNSVICYSTKVVYYDANHTHDCQLTKYKLDHKHHFELKYCVRLKPKGQLYTLDTSTGWV
jgi:hypothetical protein